MNEYQNLDFKIVDPHIHQWDPYTTPHAAGHLVKMLGNYPKLMQRAVRVLKPKALLNTVGNPQYALQPYLPHDYRQDCGKYQVDAIIHMEANWHHQHGFAVVEETQWIQSLPFQQQQLKLAGIVATADPRHANFKNILLAHQAASPVFKGIRKMASWHQDAAVYNWIKHPSLYTDPKFLKGFEHLAAMNLTFDAWGYSTQLPEIIQLAALFPETRIVLDHLATPVGLFAAVGQVGKTKAARDKIFQQWQAHISELATHPNVMAKISGLMMPVLGHRYYLDSRTASKNEMVDLLSPLIEHAIQSFGVDRVMYASNFPMDKPNTTLENLISSYIEILQPYGQQALYKIFRQNAIHFYELDL